MTIFNIITLFGGLALFLYGMNVMGAGLEKSMQQEIYSLHSRLRLFEGIK